MVFSIFQGFFNIVMIRIKLDLSSSFPKSFIGNLPIDPRHKHSGVTIGMMNERVVPYLKHYIKLFLCLERQKGSKTQVPAPFFINITFKSYKNTYFLSSTTSASRMSASTISDFFDAVLDAAASGAALAAPPPASEVACSACIF